MKKVKEIKTIISSESPIDRIWKPIHQEGGNVNELANIMGWDKGLKTNLFLTWNKWIGWYKLYKLIKSSIKNVNKGNYFTITFKV